MTKISLKEKAYQLIKSRILSGEYGPLSFLDENLIAEELSASRTPVREALLTLQREEYIQIWPQRGIVVAPFTVEDALSIFEVRELLEPWVAKTYGPLIPRDVLEEEKELVVLETNELQSQNNTLPGMAMDHHPHTLFLKYCQNKYIYQMLKRLEDQSKRKPDPKVLLHKLKPYTDEWKETIIENHLALIDALLDEDINRLEALLVEHVRTAKASYIQFWFD